MILLFLKWQIVINWRNLKGIELILVSRYINKSTNFGEKHCFYYGKNSTFKKVLISCNFGFDKNNVLTSHLGPR